MLTLAPPRLLSTRIPFAGFYNTIWDHHLDMEAEQVVEGWRDGDDDTLDRDLPAFAALRPYLTDEDWDAPPGWLFDATDWSKARAIISAEYAAEFAAWLGDTLDLGDIPFEFEEMTSPRYYNFETDRLFVKLSEATLQSIRDKLDRDAPGLVEQTFQQLFTSRDGFASFYDNAAPDKPLAEWDHNELYALLVALVEHELGERRPLDDELFDDRPGGLYEEVGRAYDAAVDWDKVRELAAEWTADKADELGLDAETIEKVAPYRCPLTLPLPLNL